MAETVTLKFPARQIDRVITEHAAMRDDIHSLTAIARRQEIAMARFAETMQAALKQMRTVAVW